MYIILLHKYAEWMASLDRMRNSACLIRACEMTVGRSKDECDTLVDDRPILLISNSIFPKLLKLCPLALSSTA